MKYEVILYITVLIGIDAGTVCNGPDYSPLGCFTDQFPFNEYLNGVRRPGFNYFTCIVLHRNLSPDANVRKSS